MKRIQHTILYANVVSEFVISHHYKIKLLKFEAKKNRIRSQGRVRGEHPVEKSRLDDSRMYGRCGWRVGTDDIKTVCYFL